MQPWNKKTLVPCKDSYDKPRQCIKKPTKVHLVKTMVVLIVMYGFESWTIKKTEHQRIDAFELVLEKTLESPLDSKEIKPVNPKGNRPWIFIGRTDAEEEDRGWDGWMASLTQWTRVWANSRRWWRTGKPGILHSMESQTDGHDLATEQQQSDKLLRMASRS